MFNKKSCRIKQASLIPNDERYTIILSNLTLNHMDSRIRKNLTAARYFGRTDGWKAQLFVHHKGLWIVVESLGFYSKLNFMPILIMRSTVIIFSKWNYAKKEAPIFIVPILNLS